ncbi:MAG: four helix bundle protein [Clostridia bacterium]|nr:four helix bundle protein [Clostridia bacterium]
MARYEQLIAWQKAHEFVLKVYEISKYFPREEVFGLTSQLRRATTSIPANIAEGHSRQHKKEFIQFLFIARGSAYESHYYLTLAKDLGFLKEKQHQELLIKSEEVMKLLHALINSLK